MQCNIDIMVPVVELNEGMVMLLTLFTYLYLCW